MNLGMARTIGTLMSEAPMVIAPDDRLDRAESVLRVTHARHWPVARDRSFVGILSLRDLLTVRLPESLPVDDDGGTDQHDHLRAGQLIGASHIVAHPEDDLGSAAALMNRYRLWCLPVVEGGDLVGVVTLNHFVEHAAMMLRQEEYELGFAPMVARLMTYSPLGTVPEFERVDVAEALMRQHHVRHLLVMNGEQLVGLVSERDILEVLRSSGQPASAIIVREIMTSALKTTTPESEAAAAADVLVKRNIGALPVLRNGRVIGILCKSDFLHYVLAMAPASER
jgi:CBS domain-containing protein